MLCVSATAQTTMPADTAKSIVVTSESDTLKAKDTVLAKKINEKKDISTTIKYTAKDSMRMDVRKKLVYMYTDATIDYGEISLKAKTVNINWGKNEMQAAGDKDSTGKKIGVPVFKQGSETYTSNKIRYNFKTKKGLISGLVTQQGEGYIHGENVMRKDDMMYIDHARYTTCNLEHPHFYINARKLKLIPGRKIVAGPFNMVFADIKTPIGFFLGFFPVPKKNKSGLIFPTYGENTLGFFLQNGGYYFAINDYIGVQVTGDYYTKGNYGLHLNSSYRKRYKYNGNLSLNLFNNSTELALVKSNSKNYNLTWNHSTDAKGNSSLSANVGIASAGYSKIATVNSSRVFSNDFRSSINYRKTFKGTPFSLTVGMNQSQNVNTKLMTFSGLPDLNFSMNRIYPFKGKGSVGKQWYNQLAQQLNVSYNLSARMTFSNGFSRYTKTGLQRVDSGLVISSFDQIGYLIKGGKDFYRIKDSLYANNELNKGERILLNGSEYGARHTVPIGTSVKLLKYFSLNPSITLNEYWLPRSLQYNPSDTVNRYTTETVNGFERAWGWSTGGTNLRTNIYGTYQFKKSKLMGIRHVLTPSISYTYSPDLTDPIYGGFTEISRTNGAPLVDAFGNNVRVSKFGASNQFAPGGGRESSAIGFELINVLEAKVRTKDTANPTKKFNIFDNVSLSSRYDLMADSFQLSNFVFNARTNIKDGRLLISFNSTFDPYAYVPNNNMRTNPPDKFRNLSYIRSKEFAVNAGQGLWNMTNANITASTSLNPKSFARAKPKSETGKPKTDQEKYIRANADMYVDFSVPWNINLSYQMNLVGNYYLYRTNSQFKENSNIVANSLNISGDISVTEKWKMTFSSSYDLKSKRLPFFNVGVVRDLHCWAMSINLGQNSGNYFYMFNIAAKSSLLQDLKLTKRNPGLGNQTF